jgi:hypothetical protein
MMEITNRIGIIIQGIITQVILTGLGAGLGRGITGVTGAGGGRSVNNFSIDWVRRA